MLPTLAFHVVGVSHHTAAVGIRERFAFTPDELAALMAREIPRWAALVKKSGASAN